MKHVVLLTDRMTAESEAFLRTRVEVHRSRTPQPTAEELGNVEAMVIRSRTRVDRELLQHAPRLKLIVTATSGFDHIDLQATEGAGVQVLHTPEGNAQSAAELTWSLVLACARHIPRAHRAVKAGEWSREKLLGRELHGKIYGVIGCGRIGSRVAQIAQAFGMTVMTYDPYIEETLPHITRVGFEELLKHADVLSFHVPKTNETKHLLNRSTLEYLNRDAIVVNTSRGSVIHEGDLEAALERGWIYAVGLDVFEKEPLARSSRLLSFENVITTPHIGATTDEAFAKVSREAAHKVVDYFASGAVPDALPPQTLWYQQPNPPPSHRKKD